MSLRTIVVWAARAGLLNAGLLNAGLLNAGLLSAALTQPSAAIAQAEQAGGRAVVEGSIVDAETGAALGDVVVTLALALAGDTADTAGSTNELEPRTTRSDGDGMYRFADVRPGRYTLHAQRIGYHGQRITVNVRGAVDPRVSIGLSVDPVALEPVAVTGIADTRGERTFGRAAAANAGGLDRLGAERARQRLYLPGDVRVLTYGDVLEAVTLGESDLFRALQRLPGVSTVDEYSAELWTRGAAFDEMRIYVDDVPIFNPLHAVGAFGAISADALGAAYLHPGAQPLSFEGGAAGALELHTRAGAADELDGAGELSLVSARLMLDDAWDDGERAFMVAARRTYLDLLTRAAASVFGDDEIAMPYDFLDITARYDERLGARSALEASALLQVDAVTGDLPDLLHDTRARWGSGMARVSLIAPLDERMWRHTLGVSTYRSRVHNVVGDSSAFNAPSEPPSSNDLVYLTLRGELDRVEDRSWIAGYEVTHESADYSGPAPRPTLDPAPVDASIGISGSSTRAALWVERRWRRGDVTVDAGTRVEAGSRAIESPTVRAAPRLALRWQPSEGTTVSAALARSWQAEQAIAPAGVSGGFENFASGLLWVVAGDELPLVRSDIATLGVERWLSERWLASATTWVRRSEGVAHPDPTPGLDIDRSLFIIGAARAHGVDAAVRRLAGRWTASLGYSYTVATGSALGFEFPADGDQRHVLDITSRVQLGRGWSGSAAYTYATGAPYTRTFIGIRTCDASGDCVWSVPPFREEPNAQRRSDSSSLDLAIEWSKRMDGWTLGGFVQLRNALDADNQGRYAGYEPACPGMCSGDGGDVLDEHDRFHPGLPRVPLIGLRISF